MDKIIGFIGLGIMGKPMVKNLLRAGCRLVVYDVNQTALNEVKASGAEAGADSSEVASRSEIIFTMLPNSRIVNEVILGEKGVLAACRPGTIIIDTSSVLPETSIEIAKRAAARNVHALDAPVSGGEPKAIDGTLAFMVGGDEQIFMQVKGLLLKLGTSAIYVGKSGSGSITKLANQIIVNLNIAAMSEALVFACKAGVDPEKMYAAIRGGLAGSAVLDAKAPLIMKRNFKPGGRIDIIIKDISNVLSTSHALGVPLPLTGQLMEMLQALKVDGKSGDDHGGIVQFYEKLAKIEVKSN
jgi:2-hydroxy-3-oxopropionate reductase